MANRTYPTALVLQSIAQGCHDGFDIMDATGRPGGTVYPILRRLTGEGLLESRWEKQGSARREQRPPDLAATGRRRRGTRRRRARELPAVSTLLAALGRAACYLPARCATPIDPVIALRDG